MFRRFTARIKLTRMARLNSSIILSAAIHNYNEISLAQPFATRLIVYTYLLVLRLQDFSATILPILWLPTFRHSRFVLSLSRKPNYNSLNVLSPVTLYIALKIKYKLHITNNNDNKCFPDFKIFYNWFPYYITLYDIMVGLTNTINMRDIEEKSNPWHIILRKDVSIFFR